MKRYLVLGLPLLAALLERFWSPSSVAPINGLAPTH